MTELLWVLAGIVIGGGLVAGRRWTTLDAANARANALRTALIAAWREHGIERTPGGQGDGGTVTAQGAMQRLCWN